MNKRLYVLFFLVIFFFSNSSAYALSEIKFLDLDYIFTNSIAGQKINDQIEKRATNIRNDLEKYKKDIEDEKKKLINQKNVLAEDEFKQKTILLEKKINDYNQTISKRNNQLLNLKNKAKNEFSKKLKEILKVYAKDNSLSMIINKKDVLIGKNSLDVTKDILDLFNKNIKDLKIQ